MHKLGFHSVFTRTALTLGTTLLIGCGIRPSAGPCEAKQAPAACTQTCDVNATPSTCPTGFHCNLDGVCAAVCTLDGGECGAGLICTTDGRCIDDGHLDPPGPDAMCPAVNFTATPVTPSIQLLIDRSGSMQYEFGLTNRWDALRAALVDPSNGVVEQLQSKAYIGATIFPGGLDDAICPIFDQTSARVLNGAAALRSLLDAKLPDGGTPTGDAMNQAVASFSGTVPPGSPPIIVLATDGDPNGCGDETTEQGQAASLAAATAAHAAGINVYVLALSLQGESLERLQAVADAGQGVPSGQHAVIYHGDDPAQLKQAFDTIIRGVVSCDFAINGNIDIAQAANGTVTLNGRTLMFGTEWTANSSNQLQLLGAACDELKATTTPTVTATFPCEVVIE